MSASSPLRAVDHRTGDPRRQGQDRRPTRRVHVPRSAALSGVAAEIASGADIKTVQARMRQATARTTLDTYGHLWPEADESTRSAIGAVIAERTKTTADQLRTGIIRA